MIDIRDRTAIYIKKNFNIAPEVTGVLFDTGLIREDVAKRVLIRDEYFSNVGAKMKTELKSHIADKWAVSHSTVEKIIAEGSELFP